MTSPSLVGRAAELERLRGMAARAAGGQASTVLLGGEAGIGKTRLVRELVGELRRAGWIVLEGGCVNLGADDALPFAPIAAALRSLVRQVDPDRLARLTDPATRELARLVPAIGGGAGPFTTPSLPPEWAQTRVFEGLLTFLGRLGEELPVALVVEDLHWADRSTRDVCAFLARNARSERVLIVTTFRTDELHRRHPLRSWLAETERVPGIARLDLGRLSHDELRAQVAEIIGRDPEPGLLAAVERRSDGNPFFAEELVAAGVAGDVERLPSSIRDLFVARIASLSERAQEVIGMAAVAGSSVDHELLMAVCGSDQPACMNILREAVAGRLLVAGEGPPPQYEFRHALVQEAVYDDLLPLERRRHHEAYARVLAARPVPDGAAGASQLAALAHHASQAHDLPLALGAWIGAARASVRVNATGEAARAYEQALDLWDAVAPDDRPPDTEVIELQYEAAYALMGTGDIDRALDLARAAVDGFDAASDPLRAAALRERYARALWLAGDLSLGVEVMESAAELVHGLPASTATARVLAGLAGILLLQDRKRRAIEVGREALALARAVGARDVTAYALSGLGVAVAEQEDEEAGLALLREALAIVTDLDSGLDFHRAYANLSDALRLCGRPEESAAVALEGVAWSRRYGTWRLQGAFLEGNAAQALVDLGRWDEAGELLGRDGEATIEGVARMNRGLWTAWLATWTGRFEDARRLVSMLVAVAPRLRDAQFTGPLFSLAIELALADDRAEDAAALADEAFARMSDTEDRRYHAELTWQAIRALAVEGLGRRVADGATRDLQARARARLEALRARLSAIPEPRGGRALVAETRAFVATAEAELRGIGRPPEADAWAEAAAHWRALPRLHLLALCRLREAEGLLAGRRARGDARDRLAEALSIARRLGARPLVDAAETLARISRLDLPAEDAPIAGARADDATAELATPAAHPEPASEDGDRRAAFRLTRRELDVLPLLTSGRSNREIAQALFISESTAGVHVSNILGKLGVSSRVEAAAIAVRVGLVG